MGAFESFLSNLAGVIGGGEEDPKGSPSKKVYTSQKQIDVDNKWVQDFLMRHGAPNASNMIVARDVGESMPKFVYANGSTQPDKPNLQTALPNGVSINDVFQTKEGQYGFYHPQKGTFIQVDPQAIYSKYGSKK